MHNSLLIQQPRETPASITARADQEAAVDLQHIVSLFEQNLTQGWVHGHC